MIKTLLTCTDVESRQRLLAQFPRGSRGNFLPDVRNGSEWFPFGHAAEIMKQRLELLVFITSVSRGEETIEINFRKRGEFAVSALRVAARKRAKEGVSQQRGHLMAAHSDAYRSLRG